ncbi:MAG: 2OG-Fe(II) oxygenase family protein, partial [Hyphomicrobiales bacterium]
AWHSVAMIENCVSVHVGNIMHTLTDGAVRPTPHRVLDMRQDRRSIGFFLEPDLSAELASAHEIEQTGDISKTYGWSLLETLSGRKTIKMWWQNQF